MASSRYLRQSLFFAVLLLQRSISLGNPLRGRSLRCCTLFEYPIVYKSESQKPYGLDGLAIDYLFKLQNNLGFNCSSIEPYSSNGTGFTSLILDFDRCAAGKKPSNPLACRCDLAVGGWMKTSERIGRARFLPEFIKTELGVITRVEKTGTKHNSSFFVNAFTPVVWGLIFVLFLIFTLLRMLDMRFDPPDGTYTPLPDTEGAYRRTMHYLLKSKIPHRLRMALYRTVLEMLGNGSSDYGMRGNSTRQWLLSLIVMLCGLFFILIYEANMVAFLVQEGRSAPFSSSDDLRQCRIAPERVCFAAGGVEDSFWNGSIASASDCARRGRPLRLSRYNETAGALLDGRCDYLLQSGVSAGEVTNRHCGELVQVGDPIFWDGASFVMRRDADDATFNALQRETFALLERGKLQSLDEFYKEQGRCTSGAVTSLSFGKLQAFFIAAFAACGVIFVMMVCFPQRAARQPERDEAQLVEEKCMEEAWRAEAELKNGTESSTDLGDY